MEKQKAEMRVEERDKRFEELQNQMLNAPEEMEIPQEEIIEEEVIEEPLQEEVEIEDVEEEKPKKKTDKQVSLFSFYFQ